MFNHIHATGCSGIITCYLNTGFFWEVRSLSGIPQANWRWKLGDGSQNRGRIFFVNNLEADVIWFLVCHSIRGTAPYNQKREWSGSGHAGGLEIMSAWLSNMTERLLYSGSVFNAILF